MSAVTITELLVATTRRNAKVVLPTAALLLACCIVKKLRSRRRVNCPQVPGHWMLGNLPEITAAVESFSIHEQFHIWHELHGDTYTVHVPAQIPRIVTRDPKNVEYILKDNFDNYPKGEGTHARLVDLLGEGIFNVDGKKWHDQRKTASRQFTQNQFKNHIWRVVQTNCAEMVRLLSQTPKRESVDLFNFLNRFTLDTIGEIGFSRKVGSLADPTSPFLKSFDRAQQVTALRFFLPFWELRQFFRIGAERDTPEHLKLLGDYCVETVRILEENLQSRDGDSFVGIFLREARSRGEAVDMKFLQDMVLNFLIAGRDTTAQSISWTLFLLMGHPEVVSKILQEVEQVLEAAGTRESDGELTYDDLNKLTYLQAVINEGLRLYPSVPLDSKISLQDDVFPDGTFVPKGTLVQYNMYSSGRSKQVWGEDASEFRPERWLNRGPISPYEFFVFNAGPRECLGKRLAYVEMKACLVTLLRTFSLKLAVPRDEILPDMQLTLGMSSGLPCMVEMRA